MKKPSTLPRRQQPIRAPYSPHIRHWAGPRRLPLRRAWRQGRVVVLAMSGLLFLIAGVVLGKAVQPRQEHSSAPQVVQQTQVIRVKDETLPPVMQRIARCESQGQHFTRDGKVVRGKRNPQDTGLFQINATVWGKKAQELGHNIHTQEGNTQMARYLFEHYGSVPWKSSASCWSRAS
jgi:hypothetical protein